MISRLTSRLSYNFLFLIFKITIPGVKAGFKLNRPSPNVNYLFDQMNIQYNSYEHPHWIAL